MNYSRVDLPGDGRLHPEVLLDDAVPEGGRVDHVHEGGVRFVMHAAPLINTSWPSATSCLTIPTVCSSCSLSQRTKKAISTYEKRRLLPQQRPPQGGRIRPPAWWVLHRAPTLPRSSR